MTDAVRVCVCVCAYGTGAHGKKDRKLPPTRRWSMAEKGGMTMKQRNTRQLLSYHIQPRAANRLGKENTKQWRIATLTTPPQQTMATRARSPERRAMRSAAARAPRPLRARAPSCRRRPHPAGNRNRYLIRTCSKNAYARTRAVHSFAHPIGRLVVAALPTAPSLVFVVVVLVCPLFSFPALLRKSARQP